MTHVLIDYRETFFTEHFPSLIRNDDITCESTNLLLGDFVLKKDGMVDIIIERKSMTDLFSSLRDSRYREQKARLLSHRQETGCIIIYIIEGCVKATRFTSSIDRLKSQLNGVISSLTLRDGIHVWKVDDKMETIELLHSLAKKIGDKSFMVRSGNETTTTTTSNDQTYARTLNKPLSMSKRKNMTTNVFYCHVLQQIPGVSTSVIGRITQEYPKLSVLLLNLHEKGPNIISEMKFKTSTGKERKIGSAIGNRIHNLFLGS